MNWFRIGKGVCQGCILSPCLFNLRASLVAQLVRNLPTVQETLVQFLGQKICWRRDRLPTPVFLGFPGGSTGICLDCGKPGFDPWVGNILWRRERLPTPVFWPVELFICRTHDTKCQAGWITSWNQDWWEKYQQPQICRWYHPYGRKWRETKEPLDEGERGEWKKLA